MRHLRVIGLTLIIVYAAWAIWGDDAIHQRGTSYEGRAWGQAYIPPTGAQAVIPFGSSSATFPVGIINTPADPCVNNAKLSAVINLASATSVSLVAATASASVYVCGYSFTLWGSTATPGVPGVQFLNAVNAPCASTTALTGTFTGPIGTAQPPIVVSQGGPGTKFIASNNLCVSGAGGGLSGQGVISYVQQ